MFPHSRIVSIGMTIQTSFQKIMPQEIYVPIFGYIVGFYMAWNIGANDVANAIGPLAVIYFLVKTGNVGATVPVPVFLLLFGGIGIACGISMAGHRVMDTMGKKNYCSQ